MSTKMLRVSLSELNVIRVTCKGCGVALELALDKVGSHSFKTCPLCQHPFGHLGPTSPDHVAALAAAVIQLQRLGTSLAVEFSLPQP